VLLDILLIAVLVILRLKGFNMNYNAERYLALKRYELEVKRDKIRALLWNVSIGSLYAMAVIQVFTGFIS
jgi:hypothetical protein